MGENTPGEIAEYLKTCKRIVVLAGDLCTKLGVNGKPLIEHVVSMARKLDAELVVGSKSALYLKDKGVNFRPGWAAEEVNRLATSIEADSDAASPCVILVGYNGKVGGALISVLGNKNTVFLGSSHVPEAQLSFPTSPLEGWRESLLKLGDLLN